MAGEITVSLKVQLNLTLAENILALGILVPRDFRVGVEDARQTCSLADHVPVFLDVRVCRVIFIQRFHIVEKYLAVADVDCHVVAGEG